MDDTGTATLDTSTLDTSTLDRGTLDSGQDMLVMTERLVSEFSVLPAGTVIRAVARCRRLMLLTGVRAGLVPATEAAARVRLAERVPSRSSRDVRP